MYRTILVPVDGSKRAEAIFRHVENLAKGSDAKVVLLKVEEEPINLEHDEIIDIEKYRQEYRNLIRRSTTYLETLQDQLGAKGIRAVPRLAYGSVVKTILTAAGEDGVDRFYHNRPGLQCLSGGRGSLSGRNVGAGSAGGCRHRKKEREKVWRSGKSAAGVVPLRCQIFHTRHDGSHIEHRPQ